MGRKEYFESMEDLRVLRSKVVLLEKDDSYFEGTSKEAVLREVDSKIFQLKSLVID